ncbi:hypothetical protein PBAL39_13457 [Pedobacter sp. BAL39]|uniref:DUF1573 domain-containing protein n=1 Tax=Pedobacter sp. BAL39 TaxID=391596 RepID=UPI0001559A51|nr:DUF1573 domain-containing protein [Pedobacter sp. BAL39]EDM35242.1 hypothetical protein PBAL39_13457 [Pedobacter sp. BAL39]
MKKILLLAVAVVSFAACQQNTAKTTLSASDSTTTDSSALAPAASADAAVISFGSDEHNFGKIKQGEKVTYAYKFTNTGKSPLIITNATATCGCTIPEIPKDPIKPGAEGEIKVVFNSAGKSGVQDKVITVTSNASPAVSELHLTGEVD